MIEILYLAAFALAAYGTGSYILEKIGTKLKGGEEALFAQATGLIIFSAATLAAGIAGLLYSTPFKAIIVIMLLLFHKRTEKLLKLAWQTASKKENYKPSTDRLITAAILGLAILNLIASLAPISSSDALSYQIALPKTYAENHRITSIPDIIPSNYPLATNMLFLDGYLISGGEMAEAIAAYIGILTALAIYLFCARYLTKKTGLIAAAIFYTMPLFSVYNIRGFVDISTAFYTLLAIYAFFLWRETKSRAMLIISAAASGFAAATKTSALITPVIIAALFAIDSIHTKRRLPDIAKDAATFCLTAAALVMPWLTRTYAQTGNPIYPLFYNIFGGSHMNQMLSTQWTEALKWTGQGTGLKELLMLPWNLTMNSNAFGETLGVGIAFLAYIPLLMLMRNVNGKIKTLLIIATMLGLIWFYTAQIPRYAFPIYTILSIAAGYAVVRIMQENRLLKTAIGASLALMLLANSAMWIGANADELKAATGLQPKEDFLKSKVANYELLKYANENLKEAKICLYGDVRGYYSEHDYIWCNPAYQGYIDFTTITTGEQLRERLKEVGVSYLLVENSMANITQKYEKQERKTGLKLATNGNKAVDELTKNNAELIYENDKGRLYEIIYFE